MFEEQKREAYYQILQRLHDYGALDRAKEIVHHIDRECWLVSENQHSMN